MSKARKTILIADDDPDQIFILNHHLHKWGYEVVPAESREEAERYLKDNCPDAAIVDLMMEEEDSGFILAYRIKQCKPEVPVIIATAVAAERGISFDLNDQGSSWIKADHYLEKGYHMDQLRLLLDQYFG